MANLERLRLVRDTILAHKERFDYRNWCYLTQVDESAPASTIEIAQTMQHNCNTCGCVAGWTVACIPEKVQRHRDIEFIAQQWLDLDHDEVQFLFMARNGGRFQYCALQTPTFANATVYDAIARINYLLGEPAMADMI